MNQSSKLMFYQSLGRLVKLKLFILLLSGDVSCLIQDAFWQGLSQNFKIQQQFQNYLSNSTWELV